MKICDYTLEEYLDRVLAFHGYAAPGVVIGGFMVDLAYRHMPGDGLFDAVSETPRCLPDAIQVLTPCTIGNGWLKIIDTGRFALILYDKSSGRGVRVFVDAGRLDAWPEIKNWFMKLVPKKEQDSQRLMEEIKEAGAAILGVWPVQVDVNRLAKEHVESYAICPRCRESYPAADGEICLGCQGKILYTRTDL